MSAVILARATISAALAIPMFLERVRAGFPSPAQDYIEHTLDLNDLCIRHPSATYFVRAEGDSMIEAGIFNSDILVVDCALRAEHGDVVIACLNGEFTVKQLELRPFPRLLPRNPRYQPVVLPEDCELDIFGVVTNVIHSLRRSDR